MKIQMREEKIHQLEKKQIEQVMRRDTNPRKESTKIIQKPGPAGEDEEENPSKTDIDMVCRKRIIKKCFGQWYYTIINTY
jgi:hypothetical protein